MVRDWFRENPAFSESQVFERESWVGFVGDDPEFYVDEILAAELAAVGSDRGLAAAPCRHRLARYR